MQNGKKIYDTQGNVLHAHGGFMLKEGEWFYWFGENRLGDVRVSCYRSKDLEEWEFRGHVLTLNAPIGEHYIKTDKRMRTEFTTEDGQVSTVGCNIERPKVLFNKETKKYVMWMHYENGIDYHEARCAVAVCDTIDGEYTYLGSFNPVGNMARDCTVFTDDDGTAYFMAAGRSNQDLIMYRLTEDYLAIDEQVRIFWPGQNREAPAIFKKDGRYYIMSSACTGWAPNQGKYASSDQLLSGWKMLKNFGDETTYRSQPAFVLPVETARGTEYLYVGDRWGGNGDAYHESTYIFLPIQFSENGTLTVDYQEEWHLQ